MALVVNTNVGSLNAQRQLNSTTNEMSTAMERLSSGKRINSSSDDAAGLAIANRMTSQVKGLTMAIRNANDGISIVQTAEGAMDEVSAMLQRMRELAVQASSGSNSSADLESLNSEVGQLLSEIDRVSTDTRFNNISILDGSYATQIQIGDQSSQSMNISIASTATSAMGETAAGLATAATAAVLEVDGVSTDVFDYQGKTFSVTANGVTSTVTLPTADETLATAATATANVQGEDVGPATSRVIATDSYKQQTVDLTAHADRVFKIRGLGDTFANVDFTDALADVYGVSVTALNNPDMDENSLSRHVTADVMVQAINTAMAAHSELQGDAAVTVALNSKGFIEFADANGNTLNTAIKEGYTSDSTALDGTFGATFVDSALDADNVNQNVRSLGTVEIDMSSDARSVFQVKVNGAAGYTTVDFLEYLNDTNFVADRDAVMGYELVNVLQAGFDDHFSGDDAVTVGMDNDGELTLSVAGGDRTLLFAEGTYTNTSGTTGVSASAALDLLGSATKSITNSITFDMSATDSITTEYGNDDWVMMVRANGGVETNIDMVSYIQDVAADTTAVTGDEMVTILQNAFDDHFSGDDAITVALNGDGNLEFTIAKADGLIEIDDADTDFGGDGDFVTTHINSGGMVINQAIQGTQGSSGTAPVDNIGGIDYGQTATGTALVDPIVQLDSTRMMPFNDISKTVATIDLTTATTTPADGDILSFVLDDGVSEVTITSAALDQTTGLADAVTKLNAAVTSGVASDPDSGMGRYTFAAAANGTDLEITHADGRAFTVALGGTHAIAAGGNGEAVNVGGVSTTLSTTAVSPDLTATDLTVATSTWTFTIDGVAKSQLTLDSANYFSLEALASSLQMEIDRSGEFAGDDAISVGVGYYTDETAPAGSGQLKYLEFTNAAGKQISLVEGTSTLMDGASAGTFTSTLANTNIYQELGVEPDETSYKTHDLVDGGIDTTADNGLVSFEVEYEGNTYSYQLAMTQDANRSFADFSSELMTKANAAFAANGISFTGGLTDSSFAIAMDQAGESSFTISGAIVDDAFGASVVGQGAAAESTVGSMADIANEINADLSDSGISVSYDEVAAKFTFTDVSGSTGANSSIELSGDDLADMEFGTGLTASGTASDATATVLSAVDISTTEGAVAALDSIDNAMEYISSQRGDLGAIENRLTHTINNLSNVVENTSAARSRIEDADFAVEAANLAKAQVMQQAGTAMLAQANASAQSVLSLLG